MQDRSVTVVYTPTDNNKYIDLLERFNGRDELRANSARNSRTGSGGFIHRQDSAATRLNTSDNASHLGVSTGVAKATFASRAYTDMAGEDQHLQIELTAQPSRTSPFVRTNFWVKEGNAPGQQFILHSLTVNGVDPNG